MMDLSSCKTVLDAFRQQVKDHPSQPAVVYEKLQLTYSEVDELTDNLAA